MGYIAPLQNGGQVWHFLLLALKATLCEVCAVNSDKYRRLQHNNSEHLQLRIGDVVKTGTEKLQNTIGSGGQLLVQVMLIVNR